jgi:hypothetical protein
MHCNFSSCYTLKQIYTCIVCTQYLTSESVCQHDHFWTPIARSLTLGSLSSSSGSVPTTRPTICDFYLVDFAAGCRSLTLFLATATATVVEMGRHHLFFGNWCRKPKVEWPYQDRSEKKGVRSIQWWMDGAVGSNGFFQLFPLEME